MSKNSEGPPRPDNQKGSIEFSLRTPPILRQYQAELRKNGISISMSGKGNCFDNAMVETFFKTLKAELVWRTIFQSRIEAAIAMGRYIDGFYNPVRRHSALDFISPLQFEGRAA